MKKHTIYITITAAFLVLASCGKKAPDVGSADVEDLVGEIIFDDLSKKAGRSVPEEWEIGMIDVITTKVDDEAKRTDFNFRIKLRNDSDSEWHEVPDQFVGAAYYTVDDELYVELINQTENQRTQNTQNLMRDAINAAW